jgi:hypothetical protein
MQFKIIPGHHGGMVSQMCEWKARSRIVGTTNYRSKWSIQVLGSSSVLAETGAGTEKPRELFLCTISSRLYERYIRNSMCAFHTGPFRYRTSSSSPISNSFALVHTPGSILTPGSTSLLSEFPCHLPLINARCASSVFPRSSSTSPRATTIVSSASSVAGAATTLITYI